jgi:hypothetical protein
VPATPGNSDVEARHAMAKFSKGDGKFLATRISNRTSKSFLLRKSRTTSWLLRTELSVNDLRDEDQRCDEHRENRRRGRVEQARLLMTYHWIVTSWRREEKA